MIVAGDIGGTKTHLALFDWRKDRVDPVRLESFHSADYTSLEDMLTEFLVPPKPPTPIDEFTTEKSDDCRAGTGAPSGRTAENRCGLFRRRRPRHSEPLLRRPTSRGWSMAQPWRNISTYRE